MRRLLDWSVVYSIRLMIGHIFGLDKVKEDQKEFKLIKKILPSYFFFLRGGSGGLSFGRLGCLLFLKFVPIGTYIFLNLKLIAFGKIINFIHYIRP